MTRACSIPPEVKAQVWERDGGRCILCLSPNAAPNAHYLPRAHGGLGVPENIVTLCPQCHAQYDNSAARPCLREEIREYLAGCYPGWNEENLVYRKWENDELRSIGGQADR